MNGATEPESAGPFNENDRAGLKGWAYVESWMTTLDRGMVSDFSDDINTLLTFAGLFSAVLAGFLIQLYVGLQPSSNQDTNNILSQVSSELRQISRQLANSSFIPMDIPLPSSSFSASASMVWINTLWFLSLILSLAAALFGMISKQWLREYLQWTTMSGLSKTQVGLRQGRYEAFKDWNTPAIIASMPVLLELALILFLLGMEVLLWTLNPVVFGICTVAVVAIIVLVIVATVLPVFRARCPYKSPVGWAVIFAKRSLFSLCNRCLDLFQLFRNRRGDSKFWAYKHYLPAEAEKDWRMWDLSRETWSISSGHIPKLINDASLGLHRMQARALLWIAETSQDQRLLRAVGEAIANQTPPTGWTPFKRLAIDLHIACDYLSIDPTTLVPPRDQCAAVDAEDCVQYTRATGSSLLWLRVRQAGNNQWEERHLSVDTSPSVYVWIAHMLVSDLLAVVAQYNDYYDVRSFGKQADYFLQASVILSGWLAWRAAYRECRSSVAADGLGDLFNCFWRDYDKLPCQLRSLLPLLVTFLDQCEGELRLPLSSIGTLQRTRCALAAPPGEPSEWSQDDCSQFGRIAQFALREWRVEHDPLTTKTLLPQLLGRMTACVLRCHDQRWKDCAVSSSEFRWLLRLRELFNPANSTFHDVHLPPSLFPHALVDALKRYHGIGLVHPHWWNILVALVERSVALQNEHTSAQVGDNISRSLSLDSISSEHAGSQNQTIPALYRLPTSWDDNEMY